MLLTLNQKCLINKIKEVIQDKFWIVENTYGKVEPRNTDNGYEFYNLQTILLILLESIDKFKSAGGSAVEADAESQMYKGLPTNSPEIHQWNMKHFHCLRKKPTAIQFMLLATICLNITAWVGNMRFVQKQIHMKNMTHKVHS